jgi:hypothetical protein
MMRFIIRLYQSIDLKLLKINIKKAGWQGKG